MINKFKKGGLNTSILAKIQQLPKELLQQVMQAFSQWALQKGVDIQKLQKDPNALEQALGQFMQELQSQKTQAARHGAKLNYLKSLKNKCAEDEELVYFKKGGSIDCGCKKKEVGGKVLSAQNGAVAKFKNDKKTNQIKWTDKDEKKLDSLSTREGMNKPLTPQGKKDLKNLREKFKKSSNTKDYEVEEGKNGTKINKVCGGSAISKFKAKCGSKLKKHQLGGSLNGIPFMQKGSSFKEAWNNARKNKVRYFNYNGRMYNSKVAGADNEYNTFRDNMNEMSALLPTDNSPKHLGWEKNNPLSNELRGNDRQVMVQGTESTLPEVIITGNVLTKKSPTRLSVKSEVYYNMPLGRIEYIGRDGLRYWMAQSDANGQWYYDKIENSANYGPKYHKAVPEGYIIPGTNTPITKNSKIGKIGLRLKKKWMKNGGSLNGIPFYQEGTFKGGIQVPGRRTQEEVDAINTQNKNNAKGLFKGMISGKIVPTLPNIGKMISSAYNGWVDPETTAITGVAPDVSLAKGVSIIKNSSKINKLKLKANKLFSQDVKVLGILRKDIPVGEKIYTIKNSDGTISQKYYDKKYKIWHNVIDDIDSDVKIVGYLKPSKQPTVNHYLDNDVQIVQDNYNVPYDYNNDIQIINSGWDDAYNYDPTLFFDSFKKGGRLKKINRIK